MTPDDLNAAQREAVNCLEGPLLVLAGPGSGKTRVITRRIARLVEEGVHPARVLAITFTNKAANEMQSRVERLLPGTRVWVSTFHRLCARLLRRYAPAVGLASGYTILDTSDQTALVREVLTQLNVDPKHFSPGKILHRIGQAKNRLVDAAAFAREVESFEGSFLDQLVARAYTVYQELLLKSNAVDFDDLLLFLCKLLAENEEIRAELDDRFRYVLVDEYQDTNLAQYQIVRALSRDHRNVCATGDPDQSIYGWRGAEIGNILRFEQDFPDARVVRLEQNYRSTQLILAAADSLIAHNTRRKAKSLFTDNPAGQPVELLSFGDQNEEAEGLALLMRQLVEDERRPWSDFAIFYRVNALSRAIELALMRHGIPYQVAAGVAFYERAEVKDVLAYLRLVHNPADRAAFQRVVNTPIRGIGKTSIQKIMGWADQQGISPLAAARRAAEFPGINKRAANALARFAALIDELAKTEYGGVSGLIDAILSKTGYGSEWRESRAETELQRAANVDELRTAARQYDEQHPDDPSLEGFLESASLVADVDSVDELSGKVTLMTLHAAKGLEFPVVFVVAVEDGLLPHDRALQENRLAELEEERRLLFVGMTRARERLSLTRTYIRVIRGQPLLSAPSRFLNEMQLVQTDFTSSVLRFVPGTPRSRPAETDFDEPSDGGDSEEVVQNDKGREDDGAAVRESPEPEAQNDSPPEESEIVSAAPKPSSRRRGTPLLTTGAALLSGAPAAVEIPRAFEVGMSVRHPQLGVGTVIEAQGTGRWRTVTVEFTAGESHSFVAHKCPLQPVGLR